MTGEFIISLNDFIIDTIIGINPQERVKSQKIILNLDIKYVKNDVYILDYGDVHKMILLIFRNNHFDYLEEALSFIIDSILNNFSNIKRIFIKIQKPNILPNCIAAVSKEVIIND